jgi:hypothetical protein
MQHVTITLVEDSTADNPPKHFHDQTVDIQKNTYPPTLGVDGKVSPAALSSKIVWKGGHAAMLEDITNVQIVSRDGKTLVDGAMDRNTAPVRESGGSVTFYVFEG